MTATATVHLPRRQNGIVYPLTRAFRDRSTKPTRRQSSNNQSISGAPAFFHDMGRRHEMVPEGTQRAFEMGNAPLEHFTFASPVSSDINR